MRHTRIAFLTTDDGKRHQIAEQREPRGSYGRMFHTVFDDTAALLAKTVTHGTALRLFMILPGHLSYTEFRRLDQVKIAALLATDHSSISRGLKVLRGQGVVEKRGSGAHIEWRLTPDYGWRGDVASYHAAQRKRGKAAPAGPDRSTIAAECILCQELCQSQRTFITPPDAARRPASPADNPDRPA